jgi:hypothetical protein
MYLFGSATLNRVVALKDGLEEPKKERSVFSSHGISSLAWTTWIVWDAALGSSRICQQHSKETRVARSLAKEGGEKMRLVSWVSALCLSLLLFLAQGTLPPVASAQSLPKQASSSTCLQPPQGQDLMKLSDTQLGLYGLPHHATLNKNLPLWTRILAHAKHRSCGARPLFSGAFASEYTNCDGTPDQECDTRNYAGYEAVPSTTYTSYLEAYTEVVVPDIAQFAANDQSDELVAMWAGVGGDPGLLQSLGWDPSTLELVQAGVSLNFDSNGNQVNQAFWQVVPAQGNGQYLNLQINTGDQFFADVQSYIGTSYGPHNPTNQIFFEDETTLTYATPPDGSVPQTVADGASAECILEAPQIGTPPNQHLATLPYFHSNGEPAYYALFASCFDQPGDIYPNYQVMGASPNFPYNLYQTYDSASPTALGANGSFTVSGNFCFCS